MTFHDLIGSECLRCASEIPTISIEQHTFQSAAAHRPASLGRAALKIAAVVGNYYNLRVWFLFCFSLNHRCLANLMRRKCSVRLAAAVCWNIAGALELVAGQMWATFQPDQDCGTCCPGGMALRNDPSGQSVVPTLAGTLTPLGPGPVGKGSRTPVGKPRTASGRRCFDHVREAMSSSARHSPNRASPSKAFQVRFG